MNESQGSEAGQTQGPREALESDLEARCISVVVASAHYAMHLDDVQEVIGLRPLTRVFHSPPAIAGVTSLRGEVLPVLDLGVLLGAGSSGRGVDARVLVVRDRSKRRAGLLVDALAGLREIPEAGLEALPTTLSPAVRELSEGVIADSPACVVLKVSALLSASQIAPAAAAPGAD